MSNSSFFSRFRNISLRNKLLLSTLTVTGVAVLILAYFFFIRTQQSQTLLDSELHSTVQEQSEQQLLNNVLVDSRFFDGTFSNVSSAIQQLSDSQTALITRKDALGNGSYWDGHENLTQFPDGQVGNSDKDPVSVFIPNTVKLTDPIINDINLNIYLDFNAPAVLENEPDIAGLYFVSQKGYTLYYPNISLALVAPPNFDPRTRDYFVGSTPENNPDRTPYWTTPYLDSAANGFIVTSAVPVYDSAEHFQGVLGADVPLNTITEQVLEIEVGASGFAFMLDHEGHILSLPEAGYSLLNFAPKEIPEGESPKDTLLDKGPQAFQNITSQMVAGEQGIVKVTIQGSDYYVAFAPLSTTGYSLGLVVPVSEMEASYIATSNSIQQETQRTITLALTIIIAILLITAGVSVYLSNNISRPLVELTDVAGQIRSGNLDAQAVATSSDEIGVLAQTFNTMTAQLRETLAILEKRVETRTKDLATVANISTLTATIRNPDEMLTNMVRLTQRGFDLYHAHVFTFDEENDLLKIVACGYKEGEEHEGTHGITTIPIGQEQSLVALCARTRQPVIVNDVRNEPGWLPNAELPETRSELAVPMIVGDELLGVLDIQSDKPNAFTEEDANIQMTLASQTATALQNTLNYGRTQKRAELESLVNMIGQRIQRTTSIEDTLQTAIRELGVAIGAKRVDAEIKLENIEEN